MNEDINLLLSYIETEVLDGKKSFMGGGTVVNGESILNLVKRVRKALSELDGEALILKAEQEAEEIVADAKRRQAEMLEQNAIVAQAKETARKIKEEAFRVKLETAEELRATTLHILGAVKHELSKANKTIDDIIVQFNKRPNG